MAKKKTLITAIIAIVVVAVVGVLGYLGASGEMFQGALRKVSVKKAAPVERIDLSKTVETVKTPVVTKDLAVTKDADVTKEAVKVPVETTTVNTKVDTTVSAPLDIIKDTPQEDLVPEPTFELAPVGITLEVYQGVAEPIWGYLESVGDPSQTYFDDNHLYQEVEPAVGRDPLMVFRLGNQGGQSYYLDSFEIYNGSYSFTNCAPRIASKWDKCEIVEDFPVGIGAELYRVEVNEQGVVTGKDIVAIDNSPADGVFTPNEFLKEVEIKGGEVARFVLSMDTTFVNSGPYGAPEHFYGKVAMPWLRVVDANGVELEKEAYPASEQGNPTLLRFR